MRNVKKLVRIIEWLIFIALVTLFVTVVSPYLPTKKYLVSYVIPTSSMEPTIPKGSLVFVSPAVPEELKLGEIIAFKSPIDGKSTILHRIISIEQSNPVAFKTKGDNNENPDIWIVPSQNVVGTQVFTIPFIGFFGIYVRSPFGFVIAVGLPALTFVIFQIFEIKKAFHEEIEKRVTRKLNEYDQRSVDSISGIKQLSILLPLMLTIATAFISVAFASFFDIVSITGIKLETGIWYEKGDVTINEMMWPGSSSHHEDEWIELKNNTDKQIDLKGWKLENAGQDSHSVELEGTIEPDGYFLIVRYPTEDKKAAINDSIGDYFQPKLMDLNDMGEKLILRSPDGTLIDETPSIAKDNSDKEKGWAEGILGSNGSKNPGWHSMERILSNEPTNGDDEKNWQTCWADICRDEKYWDDEDGENWGTPGDENSPKTDAPENTEEDLLPPKQLLTEPEAIPDPIPPDNPKLPLLPVLPPDGEIITEPRDVTPADSIPTENTETL